MIPRSIAKRRAAAILMVRLRDDLRTTSVLSFFRQSWEQIRPAINRPDAKKCGVMGLAQLMQNRVPILRWHWHSTQLLCAA
jgi:hypothetical protein